MGQHSNSEGVSESEMKVEGKNSKMEESLTKMMINSSHISVFYHHLIDNNNKKKKKERKNWKKNYESSMAMLCNARGS